MHDADKIARKHEAKRELILDAAMQLIRETGFDDLTMKDIANKCSLSKGTLYIYFKSKDEILESLFLTAGNRFLIYVKEHTKEVMTGLQKLMVIWEAYLQFYGTSDDILLIAGIKNYMDPTFPVVLPQNNQSKSSPLYLLYEFLVEVIESGHKDGTIEKGVNAEGIAKAVLIVHGAILDIVQRLPKSDEDKIKKVIMEIRSIFMIFLRGIVPDNVDRSELNLIDIDMV
ncbi:TetR/AcrR family transcriptional regulator [Spirochaeta cellobiosiphila]|uniref:TetR/AcrR family transcriptional regulator n=1 Tax=Spirochaeta cellobiosiphila TaxID=504483 RepID=UPI00041A467D|nr:TetR/AcrR family transcriptional regulator [Spirochaeta cellobiosiphila]